jgi:glutamate:GABA antiporter
MSRRVLSVFSLTMITIGSVDSIRNLPSTALFGSSLIFFFLLGAILFLIPSALVSAELSSSFPEQGGVYVWVKKAFGTQFGFLAIWFQWVENVIWYPAILSFIAATLAYLFDPELAKNPAFLVTVIIVVFWSITFINLLGMKSSAWVSNVCAIAGLILPMVLIITLGVIWILKGHPRQVHFTATNMLPHLHHAGMWVSLTGIMLSFCGMEIATVHARDVKNPQKAFPRALFYSAIIILVTLIFGSLTIAIVLPVKNMSLVAGIMQVFSTFFHAYHMMWIIPIIGIMLIIGGIGGVNNWIIAPTKGLLVAAQDGSLPPIMQGENRHHAPKSLLIIQAIVVTIFALGFLLLPSVNESYWLLNVLASQIYMFMYILMFAAGIALRFNHSDQKRPYKIPGGKLGMILVAGAGIVAAVLTIIVGFFPPDNLHIQHVWEYELIVIAGLLCMSLPPLISYHFRKPHWKKSVEKHPLETN